MRYLFQHVKIILKIILKGDLLKNMGRKEIRKQLEKEQKRTHRNGKNWMYATLTAVGGVIGVNTSSASAQAAFVR